MSASLARGSIATLSMPDIGTVAIRDFSSTLKLTLSDVYTCAHSFTVACSISMVVLRYTVMHT
jgi:hypothetical protein